MAGWFMNILDSIAMMISPALEAVFDHIECRFAMRRARLTRRGLFD